MTTRSLRRGMAAASLMLLLTSGCTVRQNEQYQVDLVATGYHLHLYRTTTTLLVWFNEVACRRDAGCTLGTVQRQAEVNGILGALSGFDAFFDDDAADFGAALDAVPRPAVFSVNTPELVGCLGGYKNLLWPHSDGDWYADAPSAPWCGTGLPVR